VGYFLGGGFLSVDLPIDYIFPNNQPLAAAAKGTSFLASSCYFYSICLMAS